MVLEHLDCLIGCLTDALTWHIFKCHLNRDNEESGLPINITDYITFSSINAVGNANNLGHFIGNLEVCKMSPIYVLIP